MSTTVTTGLDLKLARVGRRVKQKTLGAAMVPPVTESRVSAIEREAVILPSLAKRYLEALDTCGTGTSDRAA